MNSENFLLDAGIWGFVYKILTPIEWLMTWVMWVFHKLFTFIGMPEHGISWALAIIFLVIVVQACVFPLYYKSMKGMRAMQAMQPKMMKIQNKYKGKNDPASKEAMQREMMKLYKDNNANPAGSSPADAVAGPGVHVHVLRALRHPVHRTRQAQSARRLRRRHRGVVLAIHVFRCEDHRFVHHRHHDRQGRDRHLRRVDVRLPVVHAVLFDAPQHGAGLREPPEPDDAEGHAVGLPDHVHLLRRGHAFRRAHLLAREQHLQPAAHHVQVHEFPTPGSPAAEAKEIRDHDNENKKREKEGRPSLEEEELIKAKQEAESRVTQGFQREQPKRKNRGRKK